MKLTRTAGAAAGVIAVTAAAAALLLPTLGADAGASPVTLNDILSRDLIDVVYKPGTNDCVVLTGILHDPFTGETVTFTRISEGYQPVQIDHIIPLAVAWSSGADSWTAEQRERFANDPANLQATTANQSKGDSTPSQWLPAGDAAACTYSTRYLEVAVDYALEISAADRSALDDALTRCPSTR